MFCCLDQSDKLLSFLKKKYDWNTVPMVIEKWVENNNEKFIGGYTDLVEYLKGEDVGES